VRRLAPVLSGPDQGPQAHAGLELRCTSSGAPLALEPRPRRAIASPLRLRIARGGDAGAGTLGVRNFRGLGPGGWPSQPARNPASRPEAPGDFLTHKRTRHGAPGARARPPGAPVRFRTGLDWSGLWQVSAIIAIMVSTFVAANAARVSRSKQLLAIDCTTCPDAHPIVHHQGAGTSASAKPDASAQPDDFDCERASEAIFLNRHRLVATL
jgi:hypothetical protein